MSNSNENPSVSQVKKCSLCLEEKTYDNFHKNKNFPDGHVYFCKPCKKEKAKESYKKHRKKILARVSKHYQKNTQQVKDYQKEYLKKNREKVYKRTRRWKKDNRKKITEMRRKRRLEDPSLRISKNISCYLQRALKGNKNGLRWEKIVGYTKDDLKNHLESLWEPWMNWENYGKYEVGGPKKWHIDHVIPQSWFKYESYEDPEFKVCWSLKNLQPKEASANMRKNNKFAG